MLIFEGCGKSQETIEEGADIIDVGGMSTRPAHERFLWSWKWKELFL